MKLDHDSARRLKEQILSELKQTVQKSLDMARAAYLSDHEGAISGESKSEGKYDTRAIEAGYIAGAQKARMEELEQEMALLDEIDLDHLPQTASVGSLLELKTEDHSKIYFISSTAGGTVLDVNDHKILVISAFSPIGVEVIGLATKDEFEVEVAGQARQYEIVAIY
ncbi:MAG: hypothetical protein Fur0010_13890 [Bdellovibrio sp.]